MGLLKGQTEYRRLQKGEKLTRGDAILAMCYACNGQEESDVDCRCVRCPLYAWHPHRGKVPKTAKSAISTPQKPRGDHG